MEEEEVSEYGEYRLEFAFSCNEVHYIWFVIEKFISVGGVLIFCLLCRVR